MESSSEKQAEGEIIRFYLVVLLLMSVFVSAFSLGVWNAFMGPVLMMLLAMVIVSLHFSYNKIMNPGPDDPMLATRRDYILAVVCCCAFFFYLEALALIQYIFLPHAFPSLVVSPVVFQGLILFPMAISATNYVLWRILGGLILFRDTTHDVYRSSPKSFWALIVFFTINAIIIIFAWKNSRAFGEGRIDKATYNLNFSSILWALILVDITAMVLAFVIVGIRSPDTS